MDMRMNFELLTPCVQHAEEANFRTEVSRVASDFQKCFGTGTEQEIVEDTLVLQNQWRQPVGQREDDVHVACREEFSSTRSDPPFSSSGRFLATLPASSRPSGPAADSRISSRTVQEAQVGGEHRYGISCGSAVLLCQDSQEGLERSRDPLSETSRARSIDPEPGRSGATHRCG